MSKICGAKTRSGSKCQHKAGHGTDHVGTGKCRLHGGASKGAPKGNKNAQKHGIYSTILSVQELDAARQMQGSIETELAIARIQLMRLLQKQNELGDEPALHEVHELCTFIDDTEPQSLLDKMKKSAKECGEEYDPDGDEDYIVEPEEKERSITQRRRVFQRRDFQYEITRLISLIAKLELSLLNMQQKQIAITEANKPKEGNNKDDFSNVTDSELDRAILEIFK